MVEINVPGFNLGGTNITLPERARGKNAVVLSQNTRGTGTGNHNDPNFLSDDFPRNRPKLYFTAESDDFDALTLAEWREEGFDVEYVPMGDVDGDDGGEDYVRRLDRLGKRNLGPCETFGIVAYGDAASFCLEYYHVLANNHGLKLGLLVAYYPTRIPDPRGRFPSSIRVLVHLAGEDVGVIKHSQLVGIQGKRRVVRRRVDPGLGAGRIHKEVAYQSYTYGAQPGFAEHDLDEYDRVSAELAWSRSLAAARKAFNVHVNMELILDENIQGKFLTRNLANVMSSYTTHKTPHVTQFPTLTGGVGPQELQRFYDDFFIRDNPPSTRLALLSRTIGEDRVVDEVHLSFKHTAEMPWILPGVPPTNKRVEVLVVSIVTVRGGKLYSEHVYWDQASVLVQTGLLDSRLVPEKARQKLGVEVLPVVGRQAARRLLRGHEDGGDGEADNELLDGWYSDEEDEDEDDDDEDDDDKQGAAKKENKEGAVKVDSGATRGNEQKHETEENRGRSRSPKEDKAEAAGSGADNSDAQAPNKKE